MASNERRIPWLTWTLTSAPLWAVRLVVGLAAVPAIPAVAPALDAILLVLSVLAWRSARAEDAAAGARGYQLGWNLIAPVILAFFLVCRDLVQILSG